MLILGIDFETTGTSPDIHSVTETGLVMWDTDLHTPIKLFSYLVNPGKQAIWDSEVLAVNGITPEICAKYGYEDRRACKQTLLWYQEADLICAHNKDFDRGFLKVWAEKYGYDWQPEKVWIDTMTDLPLPVGFSRKLIYMPVDHHIPLNYYPHRAVFDVLTMLVILDQYPLDEVIRLAKSPSINVKAMVSYDDRELAKARGYRAEYSDKNKFMYWKLTIKECFLERERAEAGFPIEILP